MAILGRDELLALKLRSEVVTISAGRGEVVVWELNGLQYLEAQAAAGEHKDDSRAAGEEFASRCVGDRAGPFSPPLTPAEFKRVAGRTVSQCIKVALRLNMASASDAEEERGN